MYSCDLVLATYCNILPQYCSAEHKMYTSFPCTN